MFRRAFSRRPRCAAALWIFHLTYAEQGMRQAHFEIAAGRLGVVSPPIVNRPLSGLYQTLEAKVCREGYQPALILARRDHLQNWFLGHQEIHGCVGGLQGGRYHRAVTYRHLVEQKLLCANGIGRLSP